MYIPRQTYEKFAGISIKEEVVEKIGELLQAWVKKEDSWIIPQFLKETQIGWSYLQYLLSQSPKLTNTFDVVVATLVDRWIKYAFKQKNLSIHMQKILLKYLKAYDNHAYSIELSAKKELIKEELKAVHDYRAENYSEEPLDGYYQRIYAQNVDKSRSRT